MFKQFHVKKKEIKQSNNKRAVSDGAVRILLGDNTGGRAVMLWPITAQCDAV
jgi:hypothetical protein